jgi:hypothetical protein
MTTRWRKKAGGDYKFEGTLQGVITKRSGATRYVIENDDGLLFIMNPGQVDQVAEPEPKRWFSWFVW